MPVRAVLFDLGDTLIFQARQPGRGEIYGRMAEHVAPLLRSWGAERVDAVALLHDLYGAVDVAEPARREQGYEVDGPFIAQGALAEYGLDASPEQSAALWRASALDLGVWGWQLYPDTLDTLRHVRSLSLPMGIVSNSWSTSDVARGQVTPLGIPDELLGIYVSSADKMRPKPHPAPFQRALDLLGVAAADAVFVGDDLDADVRGAKALGLTTVWKLNGRHELPPAPEADYAIRDLWELFTLGLLPEETSAALPQQSLTPHEDANANRY